MGLHTYIHTYIHTFCCLSPNSVAYKSSPGAGWPGMYGAVQRSFTFCLFLNHHHHHLKPLPFIHYSTNPLLPISPNPLLNLTQPLPHLDLGPRGFLCRGNLLVSLRCVPPCAQLGFRLSAQDGKRCSRQPRRRSLDVFSEEGEMWVEALKISRRDGGREGGRRTA